MYIRVSTNDQIEYSPEAQKNAILNYAEKNNITIQPDNIFLDEGISGKKAEKRPAFMEMIKLAKKKPKPFDVILVHKFDRFARNREDSVVYKSLLRKECGIKVISITEQMEDDKFSIILESMLEAMAEYYSLNLADEVKKGMTEKAKRGGFQSRTPLGYYIDERGKPPKIVPEEAQIIRFIYNKFVYDQWTFYEIAKNLNDAGFRTKEGNLFEKRSIKYILENPLYSGITRWNYRKNQKINDENQWVLSEGSHEPIVSKELYNQAIEKIECINQRYGKKDRPTLEYGHWLSGILKCAYCGGAVTLGGSKKYRYYRCNKHLKGSCQYNNQIRLEQLEEIILNKIRVDIGSIELKIINSTHSNVKIEIDILKKQLKKVLKKYELSKEAFLSEVDSLEEYIKNKKIICEEEIIINNKLKTLTDKNIGLSNMVDEKINGYKLLVDHRNSVSIKNKVIRSFIEKILIDKPNEIIHIYYH